MPETLTLATPIVPPTRVNYTFARLVLDLEAQVIQAVVRGSDGTEVFNEWKGAPAVALMTALNTADLRANSLVKAVFQQLVLAGKLPAGTVSGTPV
jgi:hypothetical protein